MELYPRAPAKPAAGIRTPAGSRTEVHNTIDLFVLKETSGLIRHRRPTVSLEDIEKVDLDR